MNIPTKGITVIPANLGIEAHTVPLLIGRGKQQTHRGCHRMCAQTATGNPAPAPLIQHLRLKRQPLGNPRLQEKPYTIGKQGLRLVKIVLVIVVRTPGIERIPGLKIFIRSDQQSPPTASDTLTSGIVDNSLVSEAIKSAITAIPA